MSTTLIPSHLAGHVTVLDSDIGRRFALRSASGSDRFEIAYSGELLPEYGLIVGDEAPSLVVARAFDTGEEIVVFDAARHGYNAMFVDEVDPAELEHRHADTVFDHRGQTVFAVEIEVIDNIDWDDEEDDFRDDEGVLRLVNGDEISPERLRADGFDSLGVTVIAADGTRLDIVNEELA